MLAMKLLLRVLAGLAAVVLATQPLAAQAFLNKPLPKAELESVYQTNATSLEDYAGRALLLEFFAHW